VAGFITGGEPVISMGTNGPDYDNLLPNRTLTKFSRQNLFLPMISNDVTEFVGPLTDLVVRRVISANAAKFIVSIRLLGFYY
jgi:hypothetical protein